MSAPAVSVIIASHRAVFIGELLAGLDKQADPHPAFEVIAVCDYDPAAIKTGFPEVTFIYHNDRSISAKRNRGVRAARADIVAFIDDDCVPSANWIAAGIAHLAANPISAGVEGLTTIENTGNLPPSARDYHRLERPGYRTNNIFYRTSVFLLAGGFDERFTVQREDIDLAFSVLEKGYVIGHDAGIRVMHRVRRNEPWDLLKNCINRRFDPLLYRKHPKRYRQVIGSPFPKTLLALLVLHGLTIAAAFSSVPIFIAVAGLLDAAAVTLLAFRHTGKSVPVAVFAAEWISCAAAPVVLLGALIHGSIRFRTLFLV